MKAYVINLAHAVERRQHMEAVMNNSPFAADWELLVGVNGRRMTAEELHQAFDYEAFGIRRMCIPTQGEVGCTLSHYAFWQRVADADAPAVVFEDDLHFEGPWDDVLAFAEPWLDSPEPRALLLPRHFFYRRAHRVDGGVVARPRIAYGTECYFINPAGARLMLSLGKPAYVADEWDYYHSRGLQLKAFIPHPIVLEPETQSHIVGRASDRYQWRAAAMAVTAPVFSFGYEPILLTTILHHLRYLHKYLSPTEQQ